MTAQTRLDRLLLAVRWALLSTTSCGCSPPCRCEKLPPVLADYLQEEVDFASKADAPDAPDAPETTPKSPHPLY